jgi:glutamate-1-semialdehyde 2,1-aminomutase
MSDERTLKRRLANSSGTELQRRAHDLIPGGCHTYAKGDDQFPEEAPRFITHGKGCRVWDVDGREFIEYGMGLRAVTLGHAYPPVVEAVARELAFGTNFNRPAVIEVEAAEKLLSFIAGAEMVKFCKDGSAALDGAVKLARCHTGRDLIAICGDQPFFSSSDWFIGSTGIPGGVPEAIRRMTLKFNYNDLPSVERLFSTHPGQIACIVLEAARTDEPREGFLERLQALCRKHGAVMILDEMITGFRWAKGGAQAVYGIVPDLCCFGKAMANGFALSALVGKRELMRLGGFDHDRERVFLMSTTHGAETHALAALIATLETYETQDVIVHLYRQGERLRAQVDKAIAEHGLEGKFGLIGRPCCLLYFTRDAEGRPSQPMRTLFLQELLKRGVLAPSFIVSYSHQDGDIDRTAEAIRGSLSVYRKALDEGVERYLIGRPVKPVYRRFS